MDPSLIDILFFYHLYVFDNLYPRTNGYLSFNGSNQYIEVLQKIIEQNNLKDFDEARLLPSSKDLESLI